MNSLAGLFVAVLRRRPIVLDCDDDEFSSNRFSGAWQQRIVAYFERHVPSYARMITTNTLYTLNRLLASGIPSARIVYLPNGVELARFAHVDLPIVDLLRRKFAFADRRVIAYIGSLSAASHSLDLLLDAYALVRLRQPSACLLFVGGGEDYAALRRRVLAMGLADSVLFSGRVPSTDIPTYFGLAAVTVDPIKPDVAAQARSPLKLFESWAAGVPCVTGDVGDRRSLLGDPPAGLLVQPGSAEALAEGILRILSDPDFAAELGRRGLARASAYQWNILAQRLITACESAVNTGERQRR